MKALIICDDELVTNKIKETLQSVGYDSIIYKWLLKALDNVEEISPDLSIVSVSDYPRHWKIFAQFVLSGIGNAKSNIILYTPETISDEEKNKISQLGILGTFSSVDDEELEKLKNIISPKQENNTKRKSLLLKIQDMYEK